MKRPITITALSVAAALGVPASGALASGDDAGVRNGGSCTDASSSKIKVKEDDGRLEVEFEVDQNRNGETWKVKIKDNGDVAFRGKAVTKAPSGSFSIERKIADRSGTDSIVAVGRNAGTGERCVAKASL